MLQQQFNRVGKAELGSVALPAIMRTGAGGPENFQVGTMPQAQLQITSGQMHRGHMPPLVRAPLCPPLWGAGTCGAVPAAVVCGAAFLLLGGLPSSSSSSAAKEMFEQGHKESVTLSGPQPAPSKSFVSLQSLLLSPESWLWAGFPTGHPIWSGMGRFPLGAQSGDPPLFAVCPPFFMSAPSQSASPHPALALQTSAQQALTGTINSSMQAVNAAQATLDDFETLPPLGQDAVSAWGKRVQAGGALLGGLLVCGGVDEAVCQEKCRQLLG